MGTITQAMPEDAAAILALQRLAFQSEARFYNDFNLPPITQTLEEIRLEFATKLFLKAQSCGRIASAETGVSHEHIVGSIRGFEVEGTCFIERLVVHPDYQRQGIGTALMGQLESRFGQARRFELFTGYKSEQNIRLYERLGYQRFKLDKVNETLSFIFFEKPNDARPHT